MPLYEYRCRSCGHEFEIQQSIVDDALTDCPECAGELRKVFHPVGIAFKGSGFYKNDARSGSGSGASGTGSATTSSSDPSSKTSESSDSGSSDSKTPEGGSSGSGTSDPGSSSSEGKGSGNKTDGASKASSGAG